MAQPSGVPRGQQGTDKLQQHCGSPVSNSWCCLVISEVLCHCRWVSGQGQTRSGVNPGSMASKVSCTASQNHGAQRQSTSPGLCRGHSSPTACTPSSAGSLGLPSFTDTIRKENNWSLACCLLCPRVLAGGKAPKQVSELRKGFISIAKFCPLWRNRNVVSILFPFQLLISFSNRFLFRVKCSVLGLSSEMISFIFPCRNCKQNTKWSRFGVWGAWAIKIFPPCSLWYHMFQLEILHLQTGNS